jgi:hypothetical protein
MRGDYKRSREHREKMLSKKQRLEGLRQLYATYEEVGERPMAGSYMRELRAKIRAIETQLRVMSQACDVEV